MRDLFVIIGSLLIAALAAVFAVPRFIDWTPYKGEIQARIEAATGLKLTLAGPLRLAFLPRVALNAQDVILKAPNATVSAARLRAELPLASIIAGTLHIASVELDGAVVRLADGAADDPAGALVGLLSGNVREIEIDAIDLNTVAVIRGDGRPLAAIERGDAALSTRQGPLRLTLEGVFGEVPGRARIALGSPEADQHRRVSLAFEANGGTGGKGWLLTFDGQTTSAPTSPVALDGALVLAQGARGAQRAAMSENSETALWRAQAKVHAERRSLRLDELEISRERAAALRFNGQGTLNLDVAPRLMLDLSARRLVLDPLIDAPARPASGGGIELGDALDALFATARSKLPPGLAVDFDIGTETAEFVGESFESLRVKGMASRAGIALSSFSTKWSGRGEISFSGSTAPRGGAPMRGHIEAKSADAAAFLQGLGFAGESAGSRVALTLAGDLTRSSDTTKIEALDIALAGSKIAGAVTLSSAKGGAAARIDADLSSPDLDLDTWPLGAVTGIVPRQMDGRLLVRIDRLRAGRSAGDVGRLDMALTRARDQTLIDKLELRGFEGLTLNGSGTIGGAGSSFEARIAAPKAAPLAALSRLVLPQAAVEALAARGPLIEPLTLALSGRRGVASPAIDVVLSGTAAATRIDAKSSLDAGFAPTAGDAILSSPDAVALLKQLGIPVAPGDALGRGEAKISVKRGNDGPLLVTASLTAGPATMAGDGTLSLGGAPEGHGGFSAAAPSAAIAARLLGWTLPRLDGDQRFELSGGWTLSPDNLAFERLNARFAGSALTGTLGLALTGQRKLTGTVRAPVLSVPALLALALGPTRSATGQSPWVSTRFPAFAPPPMPVSVNLTALVADLGGTVPGRDARLTLDIDERGIAITEASAAFSGGRLSGEWRIERDGGLARSVLRLSSDAVELKGLAPGAGLAGKISARLELSGAGETFSQIVSSAGGGGTLRIADGWIEQAALSGLQRAFTKAVVDEALMDKIKLAALVAGETARGALAGVSFETPVIATSGVLKATVPRLEPSPGDGVDGSATIDLKTLTIEARLGLSTQSSGRTESRVPLAAAITWKGPLFAPKREADATALLQAVAVERLRLELERIELLEYDQREQAMFLRRLRAGRQKALPLPPPPEPPAAPAQSGVAPAAEPLPQPTPPGAQTPTAEPQPQAATQQPQAQPAQLDAPKPKQTTPEREPGPPAAAPATDPQLAPLPPPVLVRPAPAIAASPGRSGGAPIMLHPPE